MQGRMLLHNTTSSLPSQNYSSSTSTTTFSVASSSRSYDPSYIAVGVLIFFSFIFFLGFFILFARRIFSTQHGLLNILPLHTSIEKGLDPRTIKALPTLPYSHASSSSTSECTVCLAEFNDGEMVKVMPNCGHLFHPKCIDAWLVSKGSCPICRSTEMLQGGGKEGGGESEVEVEVVVVEEEVKRKVCVGGESSQNLKSVEGDGNGERKKLCIF